MPIHFLLLLLGCIFYIIARVVYQNHPELFLCLLIIINFEFFYLFPQIGEYNTYNIILLPILALLLLEMIVLGKIRFESLSIGILITLFIGMLALGVLIANGNDQPILLGLKAIKFQLLILIYFVVVSKDIQVEKFGKYLIGVSFCIMVLGDLDVAFFDGNLILSNVPEKDLKERLGRIRFAVGYEIISISCLIAFCILLKTSSKLYGVLFLLFFIHILFVLQTRMIIAGIILSCIIIFLFIRNITPAVVILATLLVLLAFPTTMLVGKMFQKIGLVKQTVEDIQKKAASWQGRVNAYEYYLSKISDSPLWGYGYENFNWEKNPEKRLKSRGIHKSDIGITHFIYKNGAFGLFWFIGLIIVVVWHCWTIRASSSVLLAYFSLAFCTLLTLDFFFKNRSILLLGIFLGLLAQEFRKQRKQE